MNRHGRRVTLSGPEGPYSTYDPACPFTGMGWDAESASSLLVAPAMRSALLLGFGGGTMARQLRVMHPHATIVGVEIDTRVLALAEAHCALTSIRASVLVGDGEEYARRPGRLFDFILDDMWDHSRRRSRAALTSPNWPRVLSARLTARGACAINLYARNLDRPGFDCVAASLSDVFETVVQVRVPGSRVTVLAGMRACGFEDRVNRALAALKPSARRWMSAVEFRPC